MRKIAILDPAQANTLGPIATGYKVSYTPWKGVVKPGTSLVLVQALECDGGILSGLNPFLDHGAVPTSSNAMLPTYLAACGNAAAYAANTPTGCFLLDRPFNSWKLGQGTTWTINVCAVLIDNTTKAETILGGVSFTWKDTLGDAVLTVSPNRPFPNNDIHEKPGFKLGLGNTINRVAADPPTSTFKNAMKVWNPNWPPLK